MTCTIISTGEELNLACKNEKESPYPQIKEKLLEKIWELYCQGYERFWVNCEYGVPLWCAEIITALRMYNDVELHIAMPYEEQATNWGEEIRDRFFHIHSQANGVKIVNARYHDACHEETDKFMIDDSDMLLVIGDNNSELYSVEYAKTIGVEICYIQNFWNHGN